MIEVPQLNPAGTEMLINLSRLPLTVQQVVSDTKASLEASPKL